MARIRDICATQVRYGYRRLHVILKREGWEVNVKRTYRIQRDLGLQLRNKAPKRRLKAKFREDRQKAVSPNDVWAVDLVHNQLATGKKIRVLTGRRAAQEVFENPGADYTRQLISAFPCSADGVPHQRRRLDREDEGIVFAAHWALCVPVNGDGVV